MKLLVSPEALDDLRKIEKYIGQDNPKAAVEFVARLTERFQDLVRFPGIGRNRNEIKERYRSIAEKDYVIFYQVQMPETVEILRVLHGKRDLDKILKP